jgi:hypothetical protein
MPLRLVQIAMDAQDDSAVGPWTCLADPEGNEFDVLTPR